MAGYGKQVWRLFEKQINAYVRLFQEAEIEWTDRLLCNVNVRRDMAFVRTLEWEDRIWFWRDKFSLFAQMGHLLFVVMCCQRDYTAGLYDEWNEFDEECMFVLYLFINQGFMPRTWLTRQLRARFSHRFSLGNPLAGRQKSGSVDLPAFRILPAV